MDNALVIKDLCKTYPGFSLKSISFSVPEGSITGFIGRNGAGKTTTLRSALGLVHPDSGSVSFFGLDIKEHEAEIKQKIGFACGAVDWYKKKKLSTIADVTARFYENSDPAAFDRYMKLFSLDPDKTPEKLSAGMKVKFNLALALAHNAKLLILDEPTSGLDPISREELLEIFLSLRDSGVSILFSTHITSDLDRCADRIVYLKCGEIIAETELDSFAEGYRIIETDSFSANAEYILGKCRTKDGATLLVKKEDVSKIPGEARLPTLEDIMVHLEKEQI